MNMRSHPGCGAVRRRGACAAVVYLSMALLSTGCASSPHRRALEALDQPAATRLSDRIREIARAHRQALREIEHAQKCIVTSASADRLPGDADLEGCAAAVDRCRWSLFNLDRLTASLDDLRLGAGAEPGSAAQVERLAEEFRRVQGLMAAPVESLRLALGALHLAAETESGARPPDIDAMDLQPLRSEVERVLAEAMLISASLRSRGAIAQSRAATAAGRSN